MDLKKCENNHYYDGDKFAVCPHCQLGNNVSNVDDDRHTKSITDIEKQKKSVLNRHKWFEKKKNVQDTIENTNSEKNVEDLQKENNIVDSIPTNVDEDISVKKNVTENKDEVVSITHALKKVTETVDTSTIEEDNNKTISKFATSNGIDLIVGWLVCTKGVNQGIVYELFAGKNTIGRSSLMKVVIVGDEKISRDKHCVIMYEPMEKNFYILGNESNGMNYLNNKILLESHIILKAYDRITMGDTELLFVPLCGENFDWEDEYK